MSDVRSQLPHITMHVPVNYTHTSNDVVTSINLYDNSCIFVFINLCDNIILNIECIFLKKKNIECMYRILYPKRSY